jgi:hypothetical protein
MAEETPGEQQNRLHFDYIKSNLFRVVHIDGVWGGLTTRGLVNIALYCERPPIPKQTTHEFAPDGSLFEVEELREVRNAAAIREIEVSATMEPAIAEQLRDLLIAAINELQSLTESSVPNAAGETSPSPH